VILNGANPVDIAIYHATKFAPIIDLKAAETLGLKVFARVARVRRRGHRMRRRDLVGAVCGMALGLPLPAAAERAG
jgi:hypothetical protein